MTLQNDRMITISVGNSRKDVKWTAKTLSISELYDRLGDSFESGETLAEYGKLTKAQQDDLKDVGGFVAGSLSGGRRKASAVTARDVVTLDFDTIPAYGTNTVLATLDALRCGYCVYSTRKHIDTAPRLRVIIPLNRSVTPDEYIPIARRLAEYIGIQMADPSTFEPCRLMYWPSHCADGQVVYQYRDAPLAYADGLLQTYANWQDFNEWPQVPNAVTMQKLAEKQEDPESKTGVVGAFNRTYNIYAAMEQFLPGVYVETVRGSDRYTYTKGSTSGGAVVYDNGKFLYSHHATDPCGGKLVNSFDLVRLHKFGALDDDSKYNVPVNKLPSYSKMIEFATGLPAVVTELTEERAQAALRDYAELIRLSAEEGAQGAQDGSQGEADTNWRENLDVDSRGRIKSTIDNIRLILEGDPVLKGKFALNAFANRGEVLGALPWDISGKRRLWSDTDNNGLYWYLEKYYDVTGRGNIDAALDIHAATHAFNDVQDFINGLQWDGTPRLDTLFIDYLGAEDDTYTRAVTRKAFVAAIARAMRPGYKYDNMLILCGPQGIGKSTLLDKMSQGWFNDNIRTFEGKEASELIQGVWIVEIGELDAFKHSDVSRIKQFLSLRADRYRAAYGRNVRELPRCCVFFGTCNQPDFLQDTTGNRRFWPVDVGLTPTEKSPFDITNETIAQVWAEAKVRWQAGELTYLTGQLETMAIERQEKHRSTSIREGLIEDFIYRKVPDDWVKWSIDRRRDFWAQQSTDDKDDGGDANDAATLTQTMSLTGTKIRLVERDRICAAEIWCELFNGSLRDMTVLNTKEINAVLYRLSEWQPYTRALRFGPYKVQRGFVRKGAKLQV